MSSEDSPAVYISAWLEEQAAVYQPCGYLSAYWNQTCSIRVQRLSKFSPLLIRQRFAGLAVACLSLMFTPVLTTMSVLCAKIPSQLFFKGVRQKYRIHTSTKPYTRIPVAVLIS